MAPVDTYTETRMRRLELELLQAEARIRALLAHITDIEPDFQEQRFAYRGVSAVNGTGGYRA